MALPAVDLQRELWMGLLVLTFSANWLMRRRLPSFTCTMIGTESPPGWYSAESMLTVAKRKRSEWYMPK